MLSWRGAATASSADTRPARSPRNAGARASLTTESPASPAPDDAGRLRHGAAPCSARQPLGGCGGPCRGPPPSTNQAVELSGVLAGHLPGDVGRQVRELLGDIFPRLRPHPIGVRIVGAPHQRLDAHLVDQLGAHAVVLEGRLALPAPVLAWLQLEREVLVLVLVLEIHAVEHVRDPADAALAEGDADVRVALEYRPPHHVGQD